MSQDSKKAVIYARYSSERQNEQSIEGQLSVVNVFAKKEGYDIVDTYIDRAMTGRNDDRPSFQRMIEDSKKHGFQYVLVYKLDRFSRDRYDSAIYKRALKNNGVKVISATENIGDNPESIILESMLEGYSEYYSKELAQKVRRGNEESRKKGLYTGGKVPYGYIVKDKRYEIVESESKVVKEVFKMVGSGMKMKDVAQSLNERFIPYKDGAKLDIHAISRMINNEKYIGIARFGNETYDNIVPPIVSKETFKIVKKQALRRKHESHRESECRYILSGKLFCAKCGSSIIGKSGNKKTGKEMYHYYVDNGRKECGCTLPILKKEPLEMQVAKMAYDYIHSKDIKETAKGMVSSYNTKEKNDELAILEEKRNDIDKKLSNIYKAIANGLHSDGMNEIIIGLEEEKKEVTARINIVLEQKSLDLTYDECLTFLSDLMKIRLIDDESIERLINCLVKAVYVDDENVKVVFYPSDDYRIRSRKDSFEAMKKETKLEKAYDKGGSDSSIRITYGPPNMNRTLSQIND